MNKKNLWNVLKNEDIMYLALGLPIMFTPFFGNMFGVVFICLLTAYVLCHYFYALYLWYTYTKIPGYTRKEIKNNRLSSFLLGFLSLGTVVLFCLMFVHTLSIR